MTLIKKSNTKLIVLNNSIRLFGFVSLLLISSSLLSAPSFTSAKTKLDLSQDGINDMVVADFNKDGVMDVVVSEFVSGDGTAAVEILFGDVDSQLAYKNSLTIKGTGTTGDGLLFNPSGIGVGDVSGDGILDIVVTASSTPNSTLNLTYVYKGALTGTDYTIPSDISYLVLETSGVASDVVIGHFNTDTFIDIIISHANGINLYKGTAIGVIDVNPTSISIIAARTLFAKDVNNDSSLDIVTDREILFNDPNQTFVFVNKASYAGTNLPITELADVTLADFNGDSILDVAYALNYPPVNPQVKSSQLVVKLSAGSGMNVTYSTKTMPLISNSKIKDLTTGDLDLDGINDVIMTDTGQGALLVYTGNGDGTFGVPNTVTIPPPTHLIGTTLIKVTPKLLVAIKSDSDRLLDILTANDGVGGKFNPSLSLLIQDQGIETFVFGSKNYKTPIPSGAPTPLPITVLRKYIPEPPTAITLNYNVVENSATNGKDFNALTGPIDLGFSTTDLKQIFTVEIIPDTGSPDTSFTIDLKDSITTMLDTTTVSIKSGVSAPTLSFSATNYDLFEDQANVTLITVNRTPSNTLFTTTVEVNSEDIGTGLGFATEVVDYSKVTTKILTFASGENSQSFTIPIVDDNLIEGIETFRLTLSNPTNGVIATPATIVTINDNDTAPTLSFTATNYDLFEEQTKVTQITVTRTPSNALFTSTVEVNSEGLGTGTGFATEVVDYAKVTTKVLTFASGENSQSFTIPIVDDNLIEGIETFRLTLSNPTNGVIVTPATIVTINDNDIAPTLSFTVTNFDLFEDQTKVTQITVTRTPSNTLFASTVEVNSEDLGTGPGFATEIVDYLKVTTKILTFASGVDSQSFTIPIVDDNLFEGSETFRLILSNPTNGVIVTPAAIVTINDNDAAPTLSFAATNINLFEDQTKVTQITVTRTPSNTALTTTVEVNSEDMGTGLGFATETADYSKVTTKILTFASGVDSQSFTIPIVDDNLIEGIETFRLTLSNPTNGVIAIPSTIATIIDNDAVLIILPIANNDAVDIVNNTKSKLFPVASNDTATLPNTIRPTTVKIATDPIQGTLSINQNTGEVTYTLNDVTATGTDSFTYTVEDSAGNVSLPGTVLITIIEAPIAVDDSVTIVNNTETKLFDILSNDQVAASKLLKPDSIVVTVEPTKGSITIDNTGIVTYILNSGATGLDSFSYTIDDNDQTPSPSKPAKVTITIIEAPIALGDNFFIINDEVSKVFEILANDSAIAPNNLDPSTITIISSPLQGSLAIDATGKITYTLTSTTPGIDTFEYTVDDNDNIASPSDVAIVKIKILEPAQVTPGVFSFDSKNTYTVSEETGELILNVVRTSGKTGEVTLNYVITNDLAIAGIDFNDKTPTVGTLKFANDVTTMPITLEIIKDDEIESNEDLFIELMNVTAGVIVGTNPITVTITDSTVVEPTPPPTPPESDDGGGCTLQSTSRFDPVFPLLMLFSLFYFGRRKQCKNDY